MPETASAGPRGRTLFAQIATRLVVVTVIFAVLDVGIVIADYGRDRQILADDFVSQQAERVERAFRSGGAAAAGPSGASDWAYVMLDETLRAIARGGDRTVADQLPHPDTTTLDWTRRDTAGSGVRITGLRRVEGPTGRHWILISATTRGFRAYFPVIAGELVDHVAIPLAPLTVLLLAFNVAVVRRMLKPLASAAAEVDTLDAARLDARLTEPAASREVAALVAAVNRALDRVRRSMALLKDFTTDAAHELRTPLSVMRLRVEALPEGPDRRRLAEDVEAMTRLVNQMLDLSQADALTMDAARAVDLRARAEAVIAQTAPLVFAADRDISLNDQAPAPVRGRAEALGRALRNLVENAIAHGEGLIEVVVGPGPQISVRDHGEGLTSGDRDAIFHRFWRRRRDRGGAGLGLGIARSIIEAHGGLISAEDAPGGGALFVCQFPPLTGESTPP